MISNIMSECKIEICADYLALTKDTLSAMIITAIEYASIHKSGKPDVWVNLSVAEINRMFYNTQSSKTIYKKITQLEKGRYIFSRIEKGNSKHYKVNKEGIDRAIEERLYAKDSYIDLHFYFGRRGTYFHDESKPIEQQMEELRIEREKEIDAMIEEKEKLDREEEKRRRNTVKKEERFKDCFQTNSIIFKRIIELDKIQELQDMRKRFDE